MHVKYKHYNLSWWWLSQKNIDNLNHLDGKICKWTSEKMITNITLSLYCSIAWGDESIFLEIWTC